MFGIAVVIAIVSAVVYSFVFTPIDYCYGTGKATGGSLIAPSLPPSLKVQADAFTIKWESGRVIVTHEDNSGALWSTIPGLPFVAGSCVPPPLHAFYSVFPSINY
jgi:hypothetical protein